MASIEKKISVAILTMIRARRERPSTVAGTVGRHSSVAAASVRVRDAQFSDFGAVAELKSRWGLDPDSLENWERLWHRNPALSDAPCDRPIGWVLESDGKVVGYLGNISLLYHFGDKRLSAVTSSGLVIEPEFRSVSLSLVAAFYRQRSVDLYLTTTAIEAAGKIARKFKSDALPQEDYETMMFWVLRPYPFAQALMKKLQLGSALSVTGAVLTSFVVGSDRVLRGRWPKRSSRGHTVVEIAVNEIGDEFQSLWTEKLNEGPRRLLADRSPATLRWHFDMPGDRGTARVLCCHQNGKLVGYAVIRNEPPNQANGLRRSIIADMLAKQDDPAILEALWVAAYDNAKRAGSHVFEVLGFPHSIRRVCAQWNPYLRRYPACPFYYKAADAVLHKTLSDGAMWYATPFDGDTTLWSFGTALQGPAVFKQLKTGHIITSASSSRI
jgi:hypothetical protein